ncbi:MAG: aminotransferase class I/II-fold pyridoxal phosphate-dependent enzyme [Anaerolineales bacterium]
MHIDKFEMERMQCLYEHVVDYNLSESGVSPLKLSELLDGQGDSEIFLNQELWYCESDGSPLLRERIAQFYPDCKPSNITVTNGGSEANYMTLWTLLEKGRRLACMLPNYMQAWGLGRAYAEGVDTFHLVLQEENGQKRWALDVDELRRMVTSKTNVILVTNPNNPTGAVLTEDEMEVVVETANRVGAWIIADEIYRGAEVEGDTSPTFWGRYEKVVVTSGLSKAFALPGLRIGWVVAPEELIEQIWIHHDYLTLTPGLLNDRLGAIAMEPVRREAILARTRRIIQANLPLLEEWLDEFSHLFHYARPVAGAIAYIEYDFPINSTALIDRLRKESSVLLVPGDQCGLDKGIRVGFGYDIQKTIKGMALMEEMVRGLVRSGGI